MARRIANLTPGEVVSLRFHGSMGNQTHDEQMIFVGLEPASGARDYPAAVFAYVDDPTDQWEAYRYRGRWCYGSSADRLSIVD